MGEQSSVTFKASDYYAPKFWPIWCIFGLLRLVSLLPYRVEMALGRLFGRFVFLAAGTRRRRIVDINLRVTRTWVSR
jgi:lauroyl/myristoyl acyltransferase